VPSPSAIVFDLDDTLYPERQFAFSGFDAVAAAFADRLSATFEIAPRMRELFDSPHRRRVFNKILEECPQQQQNQQRPPTFLHDMIQVFRNHDPRIQLHPDADRALSCLQDRYRLGLITDGFAVTQHAKIRALSLATRLDEIIVTDDWGREFWKPHPRAFKTMAERLGIEHQACTYVADNLAKDFVAPNALGWTTVLIERPDAVHTNNPPADGGAAQHTIASLDDLNP
jgi:putative hydrolase of the HAD superfamily